MKVYAPVEQCPVSITASRHRRVKFEGIHNLPGFVEGINFATHVIAPIVLLQLPTLTLILIMAVHTRESGSEKIDRPTDERANFEKAISLCGYGRFHYGFVLLCGMILVCVGFQNGVSAYILPSAECDLRLTSEEKGLLNVAFLLGGVLGSILWGVLSDAYGRKNLLVGSLLMDSIVMFIGSFSQSFKVLLVFRAINGFTIGCPGALVYTYVGEFHNEKRRSKSVCYLGFFWTVSWLILPGLAWILIPLPFRFEGYGILFNSWRLFLAVIAIPTFVVALIGMRYPESPEFLLSRGKPEEALKVLREIYAINTGHSQHDYPVNALLVDEKHSHKKEEPVGSLGVLSSLLTKIWQQICAITSPPLLKYSILCCTIYFANMFGYFGLGLWLPELFNRFETYYKLHPNKSVAVCELISNTEVDRPLAQAIISTINGNTSNHDLLLETIPALPVICTGSIDERVFINTLTINSVCLLGNFIAGYLSDRVGRRTMPVTTMLLAGVFGCAIYLVRSASQNLIVACLYSLCITTANIVLNSVVVDIFPTEIGAIAICLVTCFGRLGAIASNLIFGLLLDISCEVPIFLVGGIIILGGLLGFLLPLSTVTSKLDQDNRNVLA
ncbi:synaptic vesicle glycoprotein 2A isoform X2 [Cephus cinctus]|uniref:Synaptic vesicle glycoprotein 2A isoform X2 n=1 Tax=Cephus cinctus TaxID=211228 RepID=A0AAJ7FG20_CEPCN|nr:synaptic vesicle glycoprotein 2A isoform X2 [Cephus cinctus]